MRIAAVIPAFNEEKAIGNVLADLKGKVDLAVVVDDGSCDNTAKVVGNFGVLVLSHIINCGQGAALQTGIDYCLKNGVDIIVTFDADGQHDPADIKTLVEPLANNQADIVLGSRFIKKQNLGMPALKYLVIKLAVQFDKLRTGLAITDTHNGLRAISRQAAEKIKIQQDGMAHASEILEQIAKYQLRYVEIPVKVRYTDYSISKGQGILSSVKILSDLFLAKISK